MEAKRFTISGGVPAGANNPLQPSTAKPGNVSDIAGIFGAKAKREALVTPNGRSFPDSIQGIASE
jgi:hypothetical protein